jgi:predicted Zn-dependent protease
MPVGAATLAVMLAVSALAQEGMVHAPSLIAQARQYEEYLQDSGRRLPDADLEAYLNSIVESLRLPADTLNVRLRVHVVKDLTLNAFATPCGAIYIHSGLLARIRNEAQLAALLGHEMTHLFSHHMELELANTKRKVATKTEIQVGLSLLLGRSSAVVGNALTIASITGYSQDIEREADLAGLKRMVARNYRPVEFRNLFVLMKEGLEHEGLREPYFFGTHPRLVERIEDYDALAANDKAWSADGATNESTFLSRTCEILLIDATMRLSAGLYSEAMQEALEYLSIRPRSPLALVLLGDICDMRHLPDDANGAIEWYDSAASCNNASAEAQRALGLYWYAAGDCRKAQPHFGSYLTLRGAAFDHKLIEEYSRSCGEK